ncbi:hypothetical protein HCN44_003711 [Aphidius gifuensis]|uniref:Ig-like domain-containing protein n=1 Tax=Aphidius gifuensis TaxID=684658 RepID=A0A834XKE4_APHGI|nr:hypothetical protein HCN44_003711 [Aphidius gifuensis]
MDHFFLTNKFEVTSEIEFHSQLVIPCIPTSQSYDVQLFTDSEEVEINATSGVEFDPQVGFSIRNKSYIHDPINFTCSITMYNRTENLIHHLKSPANYSGEPKIDLNYPVVNVIKGDDVRINCTTYFDISKKFKSIFYWSKLSTENKKLKSIIHYSDLINAKKTIELKLLNVSHNDAGEYKCITNGVNGEKSASVHLTVHGSDALTINLTAPKEFYSSKLNKLVILKLNTESHAKTNITWYNPDGYKIIPINSNGKYIINNNNKYSALSINNVQLSDAGNYTMKVQISSFKNIEKIISIPLIIEGTPVIKKAYGLKKYYMFNDTAEFFCYAIGYPYLEIQWSLGKSKSGEDMIDQKNKLKLCEKNSTFIWQVTRSVDVTCEACLAHDKDDCSMEIFKISLVDVPDDFGIIKTKNITTAGDSFEASCLASIHTYKDANWYYQNGTKIVSNNNIIIENGTTISSHHSDLKIKSVPNIKTLMYACKAEKKKDNKIDTMDMNVTIYDQLAPLFVHTNMYNKTVEYDPSTDGSIVLDCHVRGYPVPSITWFINDTEILLTNNTCEYVTGDNNQQLTIKYLFRKCTGKYTCRAENRVGEISTYQTINLKNGDDEKIRGIIFTIIVFVIIIILGVAWIMIQHTKLSDEKSKRKQLIFAATSQLLFMN